MAFRGERRGFVIYPRTIRYKNSKTTEIYTYMSNEDIGNIKSPLGNLQMRGREKRLKMEKFDKREVYMDSSSDILKLSAIVRGK
ncbi:MAG TPA: hypothetical protein VMW67_08075 [Desulfobacteria bacterium]|nr:hypothetical protein [Desulfobacteria bacterium]